MFIPKFGHLGPGLDLGLDLGLDRDLDRDLGLNLGLNRVIVQQKAVDVALAIIRNLSAHDAIRKIDTNFLYHKN